MKAVVSKILQEPREVVQLAWATQLSHALEFYNVQVEEDDDDPQNINILLENYILQRNGTHKILQKYKHRKCIKQERHRYTWFT